MEKLAARLLVLVYLLGMASPIHGQSGDRVGALIDALQDRDGRVRAQAESALGDLKDPRAILPLINVLRVKEPFWDQTGGAYKALAKIGMPAFDPLASILRDPNGPTAEAALALGGMGAPAVDPLIALFQGPDPGNQFRYALASALGYTRDPRVIKPLIASLKDPYLHSSVSRALRNVGSSALEPLIAALKEQDPNVRIGAASALGALKNPRAIPPLAAALNDPDLSVGKSAASALREFGAAAVEPLLAAVADPAVRVKREVAGALGGIQNPRAVRFLLAAAKAPDLEVVAGAWFFYLDRQVPGSEGVLMQALEAFGDKNMAEGFVNSRNHLLEEAGLRWGRAQGYGVKTFGDPGSRGASVSKWN